MSSKRGHAACNGCRSRKQKCDELKPTCSRCRSLHRTCEWPKICRRGPAKGYIVALEQRLAETENALLQLLSIVSDETVDLAFSQNKQYLQGRKHNLAQTADDRELPGRAESKKTSSVAHWEKFSLRTAQDLRSWARVVRQASGETAASAEANRESSSGEVLDSQHPKFPPPGAIENPAQPITESFIEERGNYYNTIRDQDEVVRPGMTSAAEPVQVTEHLESELPSGERQHSRIMGDSIKWNQKEETVDLPLEFQQQFLW